MSLAAHNEFYDRLITIPIQILDLDTVFAQCIQSPRLIPKATHLCLVSSDSFRMVDVNLSCILEKLIYTEDLHLKLFDHWLIGHVFVCLISVLRSSNLLDVTICAVRWCWLLTLCRWGTSADCPCITPS